MASILHGILVAVAVLRQALQFVEPLVIAYLVLAIPTLICVKRLRGVGGTGIVLSSYILGALLWASCFLVVQARMGWMLLMLGLMLFGVGIVGFAGFSFLLGADWTDLLVWAANLAFIMGARWLGGFFVANYYDQIAPAASRAEERSR